MYVRPRVEDGEVTLAVSGRLWRDALVMFDRETKSLWSQILGEAVAGPLTGQRLTELPSQVTTWERWKARHPDTLALAKPRLRGSVYDGYFDDASTIGVVGSSNPDPRLPVKTLVFGIGTGNRSLAVPFTSLEQSAVLHIEANGEPILVVSPPGEEVALAYSRRLGSRLLRFRLEREGGTVALRDEQTGSTWSWETGRCNAGELSGERLQSVEGIAVFWGVWARYHPQTSLVQ